MTVEPYINFNGRAEEAIEFYKSAVGVAKVTMLMRLKDCPRADARRRSRRGQQGDARRPAYRRFQRDGFRLAVVRERKTHFDGISLSLSAATDAEAQRVFAALAVGGKITMPLAKTFFSSQFGMVFDPFGINWMVLQWRH